MYAPARFAGNVRQSTIDGLARLTGVVEAPGVLQYITRYGYDALDNLTCVNQGYLGTNGGCDGSQPHARAFTYDSLKRLQSATNPESGTNRYAYDNNGNLTTKLDARGVMTGYLYDGLNRLTTKSYSALSNPSNYATTKTVTYSYGQGAGAAAVYAVGRLIGVANSDSVTAFGSFDPFGDVLTSSQTTINQVFPFSYTYNRAGSLTSETYPSNRSITTAYDGANRPTGVSGTATGQTQPTIYAANINYWPQGAMMGFVQGNNVSTVSLYNSRLQLVALNTLMANDATRYLQSLGYNWSANGNLLGGSQAFGNAVPATSLTRITQCYWYDAVNRLTAGNELAGNVNCPSNPSQQGTSWSRIFNYDPYGNMWVSGYSGAPLTGNTPTVNVFNGKNQNGGGLYDLAGNQIVVNGDTMIYDAENRQTSATEPAPLVGTETYTYDGDGRRVLKASTYDTTLFVYDALGDLAAEYSTGLNSAACSTCYLTVDHLGSTRLITDQAANVVSWHDYLPFGEELGQGIAGRLGPWSSQTDGVKQRFTAKERDAESGLDYFGARYYGSALGRFTSPDDGSDQEPGNPQSWNLYGYVRNNPLANSDPTGRNCVTFDNGTQGDDGQGTTCAGAHLETKQTANVSAQGGNKLAAFGINLAFALSNVANNAFSFIAPDSELLSNTPTNREFTGQLATGVAVVGTALIGPGGEASKAINITKAGLEHVLERHAAGGAKTLGKSLFNAGEDIQGLIKAAESTAPVTQAGGNLERVVDAGRTVGIDRAVGGPTSTYTVITKPNGSLVTAFPGKP